MSAHTLATQPHLVGPYGPRRRQATEIVSPGPSPDSASSAMAPTMSTVAVQLSGASMRLLELSLAIAAIATALLAGIGR
ncbi:MAG TPA: hypothetical protein VE011_10315 [Candidatus Dormibacteraeota bacterium]|nr:hypothetical protein [Candidatus Dormibacteraeota bacterium]